MNGWLGLELRCSSSRDGWTHILPSALSNAIGKVRLSRRRARGLDILLRSLPPDPSSFELFAVSALESVSYTSRSFDRFSRDKWAGISSRKHGTLEGIDRHEFRALSDFFGNARVPVLDPDEDALAIVVARVADVERPAQVPVWRPRSTSDMTGGELACNLLNNILKGMFSKVT